MCLSGISSIQLVAVIPIVCMLSAYNGGDICGSVTLLALQHYNMSYYTAVTIAAAVEKVRIRATIQHSSPPDSQQKDQAYLSP